MRPTNSDTEYDEMNELLYTMMITNISRLAIVGDFLHWLRDYLWLKKTEATFYVGGGDQLGGRFANAIETWMI